MVSHIDINLKLVVDINNARYIMLLLPFPTWKSGIYSI
jgi:hypothetical protein